MTDKSINIKIDYYHLIDLATKIKPSIYREEFLDIINKYFEQSKVNGTTLKDIIDLTNQIHSVSEALKEEENKDIFSQMIESLENFVSESIFK